MSESVLKTRQLCVGSRKYYQSENTVIVKNKGKAQYVLLPKGIGEELRTGNFKYLEYKVNEITNEVFLCFSVTASSSSIEIELDDNSSQNAKRKLIVRNKCLIDFLMEDLGISGDVMRCTISGNMSKDKTKFATYRVTA